MKSYQELLEQVKTKAKGNRKVQVLVAKEIDNLSAKDLKAIYHNDEWILVEEGLFTGSITGAIRDSLSKLLRIDLAKTARNR